MSIIQKLGLKVSFRDSLGENLPILLEKETNIQHQLPLNLEEKDLPIFQPHLSYRLKACYLHILNNVNLLPEHKLVTKKMEVLNDSMIYGFPLIDTKKLLKIYLKDEFITFQDDSYYISVLNTSSNVFYHWLAESLPRLFLIKNLVKNAKLLLPSYYEEYDKKNGWLPFHKETLQPFEGLEVIEFDGGKSLKVKNLLLPAHVAPYNYHNDTVMQSMREFYHNYFIHQNNNKLSYNLGDKIFINRTKAKHRKLVNNEEVTQLLAQYGFVSVDFEDLTFTQKIQMMYHAKYVVGFFGSGQTMCMFMQAGSFFLDLRPSLNTHTAVFSLCCANQVNYLYQLGEFKNDNNESIEEVGNWELKNWNLKINTEKLKQNIELMLEKGTK
jgi:hypothetical protein